MGVPEMATLREDREFVLRGTIPEVKYQTIGDPASTHKLLGIINGHGGAIESTQAEETVNQAFGETDRKRLCGRDCDAEENDQRVRDVARAIP